MEQAIWAIAYGLRASEQEEYLTWFHTVHVPEKLSRPGYLWASHYTSAAADGSGTSCLALFGGSSSRVFYDPSPAQLKRAQDAPTRAMMACRQDSRAAILVEEWHQAASDRLAVDAGALRWLAVDVDAPHEESFVAWCAQQYMPEVASAQGFLNARKLVATSGRPRHFLLEEFDSHANLTKSKPKALDSTWGHELAKVIGGARKVARSGSRIWPPT